MERLLVKFRDKSPLRTILFSPHCLVSFGNRRSRLNKHVDSNFPCEWSDRKMKELQEILFRAQLMRSWILRISPDSWPVHVVQIQCVFVVKKCTMNAQDMTYFDTVCCLGGKSNIKMVVYQYSIVHITLILKEEL